MRPSRTTSVPRSMADCCRRRSTARLHKPPRGRAGLRIHRRPCGGNNRAEPEVCASWTASYAVFARRRRARIRPHRRVRAQTLLRWRRAPRRDGSRRRHVAQSPASSSPQTATHRRRLRSTTASRRRGCAARAATTPAPSITPHGGRRRRHAGARDVGRRSKGANRLLLRLSHDLHRSDAEQRHPSGSGRDERRQGAVRRFASKSAVRADLRQVTLVGLRRMLAPGAAVTLDQGIQYDDVKNSWNHYLQHDNRGAASCSSRIRRLVHSRSPDPRRDGRQTDPVADAVGDSARHGDRGAERRGRRRIVPARAALPVGIADWAASSPTHRSARQSLRRRTPCSARSPTRTWSPRAPIRPRSPAAAASCTRVSTRRAVRSPRHAGEAMVTPDQKIDTPFVSVPVLFTAKCASNDNASGYVEVTMHGDVNDRASTTSSGTSASEIRCWRTGGCASST